MIFGSSKEELIASATFEMLLFSLDKSSGTPFKGVKIGSLTFIRLKKSQTLFELSKIPLTYHK